VRLKDLVLLSLERTRAEIWCPSVRMGEYVVEGSQGHIPKNPSKKGT